MIDVMFDSGCRVCDGSDSPVSVMRISVILSQFGRGLDELTVVNVYTALLKAGVLSDLHVHVGDMFRAGASEKEAVSYVDETLERILLDSSQKASDKPAPVDDYTDDWGFSAEPEDEYSGEDEIYVVKDMSDGSEVLDDGWGSSFDESYSDDWF